MFGNATPPKYRDRPALEPERQILRNAIPGAVCVLRPVPAGNRSLYGQYHDYKEHSVSSKDRFLETCENDSNCLGDDLSTKHPNPAENARSNHRQTQEAIIRQPGRGLRAPFELLDEH